MSENKKLKQHLSVTYFAERIASLNFHFAICH